MPLTHCFLFAVRVTLHYKRPEVQNQRTRGYNGRKRSQGSRAWEDPVRISIGPCDAGGDASRWRRRGLISVSLALGKSSTISELQAVAPNYILAYQSGFVNSSFWKGKQFEVFWNLKHTLFSLQAEDYWTVPKGQTQVFQLGKHPKVDPMRQEYICHWALPWEIHLVKI